MFIVGICACPTGIAHTYMAADAIETAAQKLGAGYKVETQGSIGIENELSDHDITMADLVVISAGMALRNMERFDGCEDKILNISLRDVIAKGSEIVANECQKRGLIS